MLFKDIVGQHSVKAHLIKTVRDNRISHAQLFLGPEGCGSLPLAMAYAQYLNCLNKGDEDSCGSCSSCSKFEKLVHPDLHFSYPMISKKSDGVKKTKCTDYMNEWRTEILSHPYMNYNEWMKAIEAENKQGNIPMEECKDIIKKLSLKSYEAHYKILILWLPEYLKQTGNVLLKIIEEPPPNTIFLMVSVNQDLILNTILSRTQLVNINRIKDEEVIQALSIKHQLNKEEAAKIAFLSDGNYNNALLLLSQEQNNNEVIFQKWMRVCFKNDGLGMVDWVEAIAKTGRENQKSLLLYGINLFRECILINTAANDLVRIQGEEYDFAKKFSAFITEANYEKLILHLDKGHFHIERNANPKILFLDLSIEIAKLLNIKKPIPEPVN